MSGRPRRMARTAAAVATAANEELAKLSNSKKQEKEEVAKIEIARKAEIEEVQAPKQTKSRTRKAATAAAAAAAAASPQPVAIASTSARAGGGGGRGGGSKRGKKKEDIVQEVPEVSEETTTVEIPEDEQPEIVSTRGKATNRKRGTAAAAAAASKSKSTTTATGKNAQKLPVLIEEDGDADKSDPGPGPAAPATTTRRGRAVRKPIKSDDEIDHAPAKSTTSTSAATSSPAATRTRPTRTNARKAYEELPIEAEDEIVSKRGSRRSVVASSAGPSSSPSRTRKVAASKNVEKIATPKVTRKAAGKSKAQKIVTFNDDVAVEEITLFVASNDNSSNSSSNKDDNLASTSAATPSKTTSRTRSRGRSAKEAKSTEQISVSEQAEIPSTTTKRATRAKPQPAQVETPKRATGNRKRALPRENAAEDDEEDAEDVVAKKIPAKEVEIGVEIIPTTITASTTTSTLPVVDLKSSEVVEKAQIAAAAVPEAKVDAVDELVLKKNVTNRQNARTTRKVATIAATTTTTDETIIQQPLAEVPAVPVEKITAGTTSTTTTTTSTKTRGRRAAAAGKKVATLESASGDSDKFAAATTATTTIATSIITVSADDKPQADKQEPLADVKLAEIDPVSSSVLEEAKIKIAKSEKQATESESKEDKNEVISVSAVAGVDQVDQIPVVKAETLKRGKTTKTAAAAAASAVTTGGRKKKQPIVPVKPETKPIEVAPKIEQATSESNDVPRPVAIATGITSTKQLIESEKSSSDEEKALIIVEDKTTAASAAAAAAAAITTTTTTAVAMKPEPEPEPELESKQQEIEAMEIDYHPEANSSSIDSSETAGQIESPLNATFVIEQNGHQSSATTTTTTTSIDSSTTSTTTITTITVAAAAASASTTTTTTTAISTGPTIGDIIGHSLVDELDRNNNNNSIAKDDEDNNNNNNGAEVDDNGGSGAKTIAGRKRKIEPNEEEAKIAMIDAKRVRIDAQDLVGDLFTLGEELVGELGPREKRYRGERVASHQPGRVKLPFRSRQVACGAYHTIVIAEDGRVITFGCNDDAALGRITSRSGSDNNNDKTIVENSDNNNNAANLEDAQNSDDDDDDDDDEDYEERMCRKPLPLGGGVITAKVVKVTAGDMHAAALDEDGNVFIWGNMKDESNKIGLFMDDEKQYSDYKPTRLPRQINISGGGETAANPRVIDIASGTHHFLMLTEDGRLFSMGEGSKGQLGRIDAARLTTITADRRLFIEPQLVKFDCSPAAKIVRIFASQWCSYALTGDGTLYGWGLNNYYQLGFKTTQPIEIDLDASMNTMSTLLAELFPVKIPIAISATDSALNSNNPNNDNKMASIVGISCGQQHVAALDSDGHVYTCGSVLYGKLGHGKRFVDESSDDISISAFKRIDSARFAGDPVTYVECGDFSTFAITESGRLYSWGQSSAHIGSAESGAAEHDRYEPTPITGVLVDDVRFCSGSSGPQFAAWIGQFLSTAAPIDQ